MSLRTTIAAVIAIGALAPASAHAATNQTVLGVATGKATVNTATLELSAEQKVLMSHVGAGTVTFSAQASRADGIVRAIGPFTIVASSGDKITGVGTLVGVGPTLNVHPVGFIMTITGGTGRFANASGTLVTAPLVTPITPFTPPLLFERLESAVHGYISY